MAHSYDFDGVFSMALLVLPLAAGVAMAFIPSSPLEPDVVGLGILPVGRLVIPVGRDARGPMVLNLMEFGEGQRVPGGPP